VGVATLETLVRERDLLERLLQLSIVEDPEPFLNEALAVSVARVDALRGYITLQADGAQPAWWSAVALDERELEAMPSRISTGIVGAAMAQGRSLRINNALLDPAWRARDSVVQNKVESVLCCPIGGEAAYGVLYLQGRANGAPFTDEDERRATVLCAWLAPVAARLLARLRDPTAALRARLSVADLVGTTPAMHSLLGEIELAARFDAEVLLQGPTGSGKTVVARAIARNSRRRDKPFVEVGCGGTFGDRFDAEFFGAAPGSFTGAPKEGLTGFVAAAEGGTLFLDEVGELPPAAQAALLQFLDEGRRYRRIGEVTWHHADVRVIAATNRDLEAEAAEGRFRADLWHRLSTLTIRVPGLSERRDDLPLLAAAILADRAVRHRLPPHRLSPAALGALQQAPWPGNIRQLGKVLEVALMRAHLRGDAVVTSADLFGEAEPEQGETWQSATWRFQGRVLRERLEQHDWHVATAAKSLDVAVSHLHALIKAHGLRRK
jgi:DNA-binding NtrC family response regulator